jgi:hypothetical protein
MNARIRFGALGYAAAQPRTSAGNDATYQLLWAVDVGAAADNGSYARSGSLSAITPSKSKINAQAIR